MPSGAEPISTSSWWAPPSVGIGFSTASKSGSSAPFAGYRDAAKEGQAWLGGLAELRNVIYVDLPTSHWPMWSLPQELARIISDIAQA